MRNVDTNHTTRKQQPWDLIAQDTNATKEVKHFTSTACAQKWSYLEMRYSRKLDRMGKTGRGSGVWLYFDQMRNVLEKELISVKSCTSKLVASSKATSGESIHQVDQDLFEVPSKTPPDVTSPTWWTCHRLLCLSCWL